MKNIYRKLLSLVIFASLITAQSFAAVGEGDGVDIKEFKRIKDVKNIFNKKNKAQDAPKSLQLKEVPLDESPFSMFEDEQAEIGIDGQNIPNVVKQADEKKLENPKPKRKIKFFNFKRKTKKTVEPVIEEEIINEENSISKDEDEKTYINDTDLVYIKEVEVYGNNLIDANYIKEQISSKAGDQYNRANVSNDLRVLYNTGFFTQNLRALPIKIDEKNVKLRIILEENPPIIGFGIVGANSIPTKEIMEILDEYKGLPQNILGINNAINEIQELYSTRGYILARVKQVSDDPDGYINIQIDEGIIGDIVVEGNNKTKDFIVKRNIFLQPGCVYNENTMRSDILRLMGTQAFKDVQRELKQDEETGLYDVYVSLEEQRTGKISLGVGIDSASGFFGSVGFGENNFRGLGQKLNLNILAGTGILMHDSSVVRKPNLQGEISFLEPMFKRDNQSLSVRGFARYYGSYQVPLAIEKRFGGEVSIGRKFITYKNLSGSISFGAESVNISEGGRRRMQERYAERGIDWSNRKKELDDGFYVKITPALTYDTRDNAVNARRGILARATLEENLALSGKTFGKLHGMIKKYVPLGKKSSLVFTARGGGKLHGSVPEFAAYSLGGPYTIRGFNISEVGVGSGYMMGSAEVRVPIPFIDRLTSNTFINNIRLAGFVDAGKLFNKTIGTQVYGQPGYAISAGVGLRIFIPSLGPINLDYGIPITNTGLVNRKHGFFTFGMGDMF